MLQPLPPNDSGNILGARLQNIAAAALTHTLSAWRQLAASPVIAIKTPLTETSGAPIDLTIRCVEWMLPRSMEFLHGHPLSPEELELIRRQIEEGFEVIAAVDDEIRGIVARSWPHLLSELPPEEQ